MDAKYYDDRISALEAERNKIVTEANPILSRLTFLEAQLQLLREMKQTNDETMKRLEEDNRVLREMADATLGGKSNGTLGPSLLEASH
jgi:hypothetical protein